MQATQTIANAIATKVTKASVAVSAGVVSSPSTFSLTWEQAFLYALGFFVSIVAFWHNEEHVNKSNSKKQFFSKALRYTIVGAFTFPSAYAYAGVRIWDYDPFKGLAGVIATMSIIMIWDAYLDGKSKSLKG